MSRLERLDPWVTGGLLLLLAVVAVSNALTYEPVRGFDAERYIEYTEDLVETRELPTEGATYTPPGFFVLAALTTRAGEAAGVDPAERGTLLLNAAVLVLTAVLVLVLARLLFPRRPVAQWAALAFFVSLPLVLKSGAMFHPQPLAMLLTTAALAVATWMIVRRSYRWQGWVALALLLGAAQLVRSAAVWAALAVAVGLFAAGIASARRLSRFALRFGLAAAAALLVALPWYAHVARDSASAIFGTDAYGAIPLQDRWPAAFYVSAALPDVVTAPHRESLPRRFWALLYADTWGDYFGSWAWGGPDERTAGEAEPRLQVQSVAGLLPTALAGAGWFALLLSLRRHWRERPERILAVLLPAAGLAAVLLYAIRVPAADGDTVKAIFLLPAVPAWAVCFGFAVAVLVERFPRGGAAAAAIAAAAGVTSVAFGTYALVS
ncbi:MAG TPA: hypothetical protein VM204_01225 [Gaiellaceae bacterium]|nr:hypothetical protein [Gaiellaceae bacterium]